MVLFEGAPGIPVENYRFLANTLEVDTLFNKLFEMFRKHKGLTSEASESIA